ncbi:histidine phosphatase family protein [Marinactinospora thermotolerans]|uniref:Probable phosphoglycerate mutase n=1 Tax=Marinactinospora thermotolerans DSM 45154 TaxID=1122192 RepID=A0A1T4KK70_9ACTN|nr:histidine phosphatase family protein [Marinactinospora thermotolerans]SJZ42785.1 probable phosphoglycerate mutase [Marinactinospora thermotolerans DSM 45154]
MRLSILRHGQTPSNVIGLLDTAAPGPGLTPLGERQAEAVPAVLRDRRIDAIVVSSLVRTRLTAAPLAGELGLEPVVLEGVREVEAGDLEMAGDPAAHQTYLDTVFAWARGHVERRMPGGFDGRAFLGRFDHAMEQIAAHGWDEVVVVSHGAAIRSWASARVAGVDVAEVERTPLANTGMVEIEGDPASGWRLLDWTSGPVGGVHLTALRENDPTGEAVDA